MSLSDKRFAYGPFAPHWVPKQYIQDYFASHHTDRFLVLNTTVEDVTRHRDIWKLTLRRHDPVQRVDIWWEEHFDALVIADGHYSVPYVCHSTFQYLTIAISTKVCRRSQRWTGLMTICAPFLRASRTASFTDHQPTTLTRRSSSSETPPRVTM